MMQGIHRMELSYHDKILLKYRTDIFKYISLTWQIDLPECE
jgi:hypothetical protein